MATPIPPINANAQTEIDIQDSCNCCWGRKVKKKPKLPRQDAAADLFVKEITVPVRDANETYNLNVNVNVDTHKIRRKSHDSKHSHASKEQSSSTKSLRGSDQDSSAKSE